MCKMSMGGNDTHKNKLVKISKLKQNAKKHQKKKKIMYIKRHNFQKKMQKREMKNQKRNATNEENNPTKKERLVDLVIIIVITIIEKNKIPITQIIKKNIYI